MLYLLILVSQLADAHEVYDADASSQSHLLKWGVEVRRPRAGRVVFHPYDVVYTLVCHRCLKEYGLRRTRSQPWWL